MTFLVELLRDTHFSFLTEWVLAWALLGCFSIKYSIDYMVFVMKMALLRRNLDRWCHEIPITPLPQTKSRFSVSNYTRLEQLESILEEKQLQQTIIDDDDRLVQILRCVPAARHLASLIMVGGRESGVSTTTKISNKLSHILLVNQLGRVWPRLLEFPRSQECEEDFDFKISLILPAYKERAEDVEKTVMHALKHSKNPFQTQVVVVDAGGCPGLSETLLNNCKGGASSSSWGRMQIVPYTAGGGRGGSLNYGAMQARGKILTFLHSDTLLPDGWDVMVEQSFSNNDSGKIAHACAFTMGIDLSQDNGLKGGRCPPGIIGAGYLGYLRCRWWSLPYGDSALSFPATFFRYLGGYPDQPLMEDYEIMRLLRQRAQIFEDERLVVLPAKAKCSPRRWQTYGVCYTVFVNALCIHKYNNGATTEDLYQFYYPRRSAKKTS